MMAFLAMALVVLADDAAAAALLTQAGAKVKSDGGVVTEVSFKDSSALTKEHYRAIGGLAKLRALTLYNQCKLTDETLALLSTLELLEDLEIDGSKITDDGLK